MTTSERITYVGHATTRIELGGVRILTDPVLRDRVGPLIRHGAPPAPEVTTGLDAVLVSHLHHDHADVPSLRRLDRATPLLVPPGSTDFFTDLGFSQVTGLAPGDSAPVGAATVTATEALHPAERRLKRASAAIGFVIEGGGRRVYFAGDTDLFDGMEEIGNGGLDLALLPIWGWGPNLGEGHLNPERATRAAALLAPRIVIPIHWGTLYPLGLRRLRPGPVLGPAREFAARMRELEPQVEARVLAPGESTSLTPGGGAVSA